MDPIAAAMALAQFVPQIIGWVSGKGSGAQKAAQKVVDIAQQITGQSSPDAAINALKSDPNLVLQYRKAILDHDLEMQKLVVQNETDINLTMQAEAKADHWPTYSWRPYNGFLFGTTVFCTYFVLPVLKINPPVIPVEMWMSWAAILGVASFFRGKMQADPRIPTDNRG